MVIQDEGLRLHPDIKTWGQVKDIMRFVEEIECTDTKRLEIFAQALSLGTVSVPIGLAKRKALPEDAMAELRAVARQEVGSEARRLHMEIDNYARRHMRF
jgi:hypothetical protein